MKAGFHEDLYLVGGLEHFFHIYIYIGDDNPNWLSYFSEGWLNQYMKLQVADWNIFMEFQE